MLKSNPVTIDCETFAIQSRPDYPPKVVGVAIKYPGKQAHYYSFGHPTRNNCDEQTAIEAVRRAYTHPGGILAHHAKFDVDCIQKHMGIPIPHWSRLHCSMLLLFLDDPHSDKLALKPSAERLLGMPPEEQQAVAEWLVANQPVEGVRITLKNFGAYIAFAPGDLVGTYADGDVIRAEGIYNLLMPKTLERNMGEAYARERKLISILLEMEKQGIRVDFERLWSDVQMYDEVLCEIDAWLRDRLDDAEVNLDSGPQLVASLMKAGLLDAQKLGVTPTSTPEKIRYKSDKESLSTAISDPVISGLLQYRAQLGTCLGTFMKPWLETTMQSGGLIFTQWNQIRSGEAGARTGRFSSSPNFMNIPQMFKPIWRHDVPLAQDLTTEQYEKHCKLVMSLPLCPLNLPPLPLVRGYVIPYRDGDVLIDRDFSGQEPRIFGHFEGGPLMEAYNADPWLDLHDHATKIINGMLGTSYTRKVIKGFNLGMLYGMGVGLLASSTGITMAEAKQVRDAVLRIFPGLAELNHDMKARALNNVPIRTWGGREYYVEPPKFINGKHMTFEYKLINILMQGSAADCTKQAIIDYWEVKEPEVKLLLNVHDELLISAPAHMRDSAMETLRMAMEQQEFDVPMLSEGTISETTWAQMRGYDKKGKRV